jgi:tRNA threonylcarbamoyladenosine biosynthesis protein TsaB
MILLAVDTTTPDGSVALLKDRKLLSEIGGGGPFNHSRRLLPAVHFGLETNHLEIRDMDAFAVSAGPGSFTGIRVGMSTVKSFAYALDRPIAPVSTLTALAAKLRQPLNRLICPLMDAKKSQVYAALFENRKNRLTELVPQGSYSPDRFFSLCPSNRIIHFIGTGISPFREKIFDYFGDKARLSQRSPFIAYEVGLLGFDMIEASKGKNHLEAEPLYFRKSQAEEGH